MDIFNLLSYINKVSLLAFIVTIVVVAYQIYILKKEKNKEQKPSIPEFKDIKKSDEVINYTNLPDFLTKKNSSLLNYSKLIFLTISLLTIVVIIFILIIIKKNNSSLSSKELPAAQVIKITKAPNNQLIVKKISPTVTIAVPSPTIILSVSPTVTILPSPTEIVLAQKTDLAPTIDLTETQAITNSPPKVLPETDSI